MNYQDAWNWPAIPVDEIPREEIETLFSFGHYDGPATGLVKWQDKYWYVHRFSIEDERYWVIELDEHQQKYAYWYGQEWANSFHNQCCWTADGIRLPVKLGRYAESLSNFDKIAYHKFYQENKHPEPHQNAQVVGYFDGWKLIREET